MAEKPIIFSTPMVQAILDNRKTQTRRVIKPQPELLESGQHTWKYYLDLIGENEIKHKLSQHAYYHSGDILWVRETWRQYEKAVGEVEGFHVEQFFAYKTDEYNSEVPKCSEWYDNIKPVGLGVHIAKKSGSWNPSIHMPRVAARIFLRVTDVRVERVQEISTDNALAEGIRERILQPRAYELNGGKKIYEYADDSGTTYSAVEAYEKLWDSLNAKRGYGWDSNPWVWVYSFEKVV